ncbi:hypothetical protein NliqN6_5899 [Naganishia liquefaciens]|uniref:Uncharacterized protein n=1 Tax=Naganishia liquefaciens TaxID=104408 RepID=A0A8H3TYL0_9TREE|nr:hypothetical protein NliqN6_5899 [Naganishia liquefaciens]
MFGIKSGIPLSTSLLLLLCGTASVLAQADWDEKWKSFTYNFGAWEDKKELAAIKPEKGTCSLVLQAGLDPRKGQVVFPWCYPGGQAPWVADIKDSGAERVFTHFIKTGSDRHPTWSNDSPEPPKKNPKIESQIYILDGLEPLKEDPRFVRAKSIARISMNPLYEEIRIKAIKMGGGEIEIDDSWPTYPNPQYWGVGQPFKDAGELTGHRAYVYTDDGQPALVSEE